MDDRKAGMQDSQDNHQDDPHPNAGRASGYTDDQGRDIGENIINRVTEMMLGPQTKVIQLAAQLNATSTLQDQRFQYILNQLTAFLEKEDARHDTYSGELHAIVQQFMGLHETVQQVLIVSKESTTRLGKIDRDFRDMTTRLGSLEHGQIDTNKQLQDAIARIQALEDNNHRLEALEAAIQQAKRDGDHGVQ